jgi:prepilin-type N-terminal cleavage/methylation domain-containing protein
MKRAEAGVTLIELLVAVSLLSLLSVGMVMAIQVGLSAYTRTESKLMANRRAAGAQKVLQEELEGMIPAYVMCGGGPAGPGTRAVLFQGLPDSVWMVSAFSLQQGWRGQAQILQLFVIPGDESGGVRLVVNEIPYSGPRAAGPMCTNTVNVPNTIAKLAVFGAPRPSPNSFVLADKLAYCRFSYFSPAPGLYEPPAWRPNWAAKGWPLAVRIEMAPLAPDASRLQPITVTAPIHIRRDSETNYVSPY